MQARMAAFTDSFMDDFGHLLDVSMDLVVIGRVQFSTKSFVRGKNLQYYVQVCLYLLHIGFLLSRKVTIGPVFSKRCQTPCGAMAKLYKRTSLTTACFVEACARACTENAIVAYRCLFCMRRRRTLELQQDFKINTPRRLETSECSLRDPEQLAVFRGLQPADLLFHSFSLSCRHPGRGHPPPPKTIPPPHNHHYVSPCACGPLHSTPQSCQQLRIKFPYRGCGNPPMGVKRGEGEATPECKYGGNERYPRKSADQRRRPTRFPHAKVRHAEFSSPALVPPTLNPPSTAGYWTLFTLLEGEQANCSAQNIVAERQHIGTMFADYRLVTIMPAGSPANREPSVSRSDQSDARPVSTASQVTQAVSDKVWSNDKRIAKKFRATSCVVLDIFQCVLQRTVCYAAKVYLTPSMLNELLMQRGSFVVTPGLGVVTRTHKSFNCSSPSTVSTEYKLAAVGNCQFRDAVPHHGIGSIKDAIGSTYYFTGLHQKQRHGGRSLVINTRYYALCWNDREGWGREGGGGVRGQRRNSFMSIGDNRQMLHRKLIFDWYCTLRDSVANDLLSGKPCYHATMKQFFFVCGNHSLLACVAALRTYGLVVGKDAQRLELGGSRSRFRKHRAPRGVRRSRVTKARAHFCRVFPLTHFKQCVTNKDTPGGAARHFTQAPGVYSVPCNTRELPPSEHGAAPEWNARAEETGDPRENPQTSDIVRHDSHIRKSGSDPAGDRTRTGMKGRGNRRSLRKPAYQPHRPTRFPLAKIRSDPTGDRTRFALVEGEQSNRSENLWQIVSKVLFVTLLTYLHLGKVFQVSRREVDPGGSCESGRRKQTFVRYAKIALFSPVARAPLPHGEIAQQQGLRRKRRVDTTKLPHSTGEELEKLFIFLQSSSAAHRQQIWDSHAEPEVLKTRARIFGEDSFSLFEIRGLIDGCGEEVMTDSRTTQYKGFAPQSENGHACIKGTAKIIRLCVLVCSATAASLRGCEGGGVLVSHCRITRRTFTQADARRRDAAKAARQRHAPLRKEARVYAQFRNEDWLDYSPPTLGEPGSIASAVTPGLSSVGIALDDDAGRRDFSGISFSPCPFQPWRSSILSSPLSDRLSKTSIEVSMEQRRKERAGETGDPRESPPTSGIARYDSHLRKSGVNRQGIEPGSPWWEASRLTARAGRTNIAPIRVLMILVPKQAPCSLTTFHHASRFGDRAGSVQPEYVNVEPLSVSPRISCHASLSKNVDANSGKFLGRREMQSGIPNCHGLLRVWSSAGMQRRGKREILEKTLRRAASSGTIPTYENPRATPPGIVLVCLGWGRVVSPLRHRGRNNKSIKINEFIWSPFSIGCCIDVKTLSLTELHVIGAHDCEMSLYWRRATQGVSRKVWSNDKRIAKTALDDSAPIADLQENKKRIPYLKMAKSSLFAVFCKYEHFEAEYFKRYSHTFIFSITPYNRMVNVRSRVEARRQFSDLRLESTMSCNVTNGSPLCSRTSRLLYTFGVCSSNQYPACSREKLNILRPLTREWRDTLYTRAVTLTAQLRLRGRIMATGNTIQFLIAIFTANHERGLEFRGTTMRTMLRLFLCRFTASVAHTQYSAAENVSEARTHGRLHDAFSLTRNAFHTNPMRAIEVRMEQRRNERGGEKREIPWPDYSSPIQTSRVRFPSGALSDFRMWEYRAGRCRCVGRRAFSQISRFPRPCIPALLHTHVTSLSSAVKISVLSYAMVLCNGVSNVHDVQKELKQASSEAYVPLKNTGQEKLLVRYIQSIRGYFLLIWRPAKILLPGFSHRILPLETCKIRVIIWHQAELHSTVCTKAGNISPFAAAQIVTQGVLRKAWSSDKRIAKEGGELFCPDRDISPTGILSATPRFAAPAGTNQGAGLPRIRLGDQTLSGPHTAN
ncbi:hypothetical protein PR048_012055 [Dryococelus australis]|uniref:Uncharacterized protein n=1 Tax=Dryococelus australis TaxID=614101 RepID=A0ABQ9HNX2_9NEOP|nr:hypothetical protein PR048_012055 [Dryococelus australis]